jgi:hypothetical protein
MPSQFENVFLPSSFCRVNARQLRQLACTSSPSVATELIRIAEDWEARAAASEAAALEGSP